MYKLPENTLKALLDYLTSKPYREVAPYIQILTALEKEEEKKEPVKENVNKK